MKILCFEIVNNRRGKYAVVDIHKRVRDIWIKGDNESAYLAYRNITGWGVQESHRVVKTWLKKWEGEKV